MKIILLIQNLLMKKYVTNTFLKKIKIHAILIIRNISNNVTNISNDCLCLVKRIVILFLYDTLYRIFLKRISFL